MTLKEKQTGLANLLLSRGVISRELYNALVNTKASHDMVETMFSTVENPDENSITFLARMCQYSR